jgi:integration host factor subunit beta
MTRSELIARIAARASTLTTKGAEVSVSLILDSIADALTHCDRVEIRGFGSFALNYRPPRTSRNPKSGDKVQVLAKRVPHFKAGKALREGVAMTGNRPGPQRASE